MLSIVVPVYNEKENVEVLILRIERTLSPYFEFEIIFVDDKSDDGTFELLSDLSQNHPIRVFRKIGKRGKSYSLVQGLREAQFDTLAIIDADLQYPPEAILEMVKKLNEFDVVVANRKTDRNTFLRKALSGTFRLINKSIFNLNFDVQSGLKVFRREVWESSAYKINSPWTFDLEFLRRSRDLGFKIGSVDIEFSKRN